MFFSRTTWVSWHQKGKPFWILLEHEMMGWQLHQLDHMQITCTSLHTDKTHQYPTTLLFTGWMPFLPLNQQRQSAADNCWRMLLYIIRKSAVFVL